MKITPDSNSNLPDYLQIFVKGHNEFKADIDHIISYHKQDDTFKTRDQYSQSLFGNTTMWLNKKQIEKEFYLSVECFETPCNYSVYIIPQEIPKLKLDEQYTYYVTEENTEMTFVISGTPTYAPEKSARPTENNVVSVWAKGSKEIKTILTGIDGLDNVKHSKYEGYLVKLKEMKEFEYTLTVSGKPGDLITIGSQFIDGNNICPLFIYKNGYEMTGFLKKNFKEKQCFRIYDVMNRSFNKIYWDNNAAELSFLGKNAQYKSTLYCLGVPANAEYDEIFFSFHFLLYSNIQKELIKYPYSYLGKSYPRFIFENETIGLVATEPDKDYNYLTYSINSTIGDVKVSLVECDNYPFCDINKDVHSKGISLINYNAFYSYVYKKEERDKEITAISKKQNIFVITCEKSGIVYCPVYVNIYTDKDIVYVEPKTIVKRFTREGNEEKFLISQKYFSKTNVIYLNIEVFTGDIDIIINGAEYKEYNYQKNHKLFVITGKSIEFMVTIKAKTNSAYSLKYTRANRKENELSFEFMDNFVAGTHYLLNSNFSNLNFVLVENQDNEHLPDFTNYKYDFTLVPLNCKMSVKRETKSSTYVDLEDKGGFYQELFVYKNVNIYDLVKYKINVEEKKENEECLFYASLYIMEDIDFLNKITLIDNVTLPYVYSPDNYNRTFIYAHSILEHYAFFNFTMIPDQKYQVTMRINDENLNDAEGKQTVNKTSTYILTKDGAKRWCNKNINQPCKLSINFYQMDHEKPAVFYLGVIPYGVKPVYPSTDPETPKEPEPETPKEPEPEPVPGSASDNNQSPKNTSVFSVTFVSLLVIFVAIAAIITVYIIFRCRRKSANQEYIDNLQNIALNQEMVLSD